MKQTFKSIYFPEFSSDNNDGKSLTLAFSPSEEQLYEQIKNLSSLELRNLLSAQTYEDLCKFAENEHLALNTYCVWKLRKELESNKRQIDNAQLKLFKINPIHVTFEGGKDLPFQSWFPYLEGYSPKFVESIIETYLNQNTKSIYDPFSGTGTTPFASSGLNYVAYYSEINPMLQLISAVKFKSRNLVNKKKTISEMISLSQKLNILIENYEENKDIDENYKNTFGKSKFFDEKTYSSILKLRSYINHLHKQNDFLANLLTVATIANLVKCSLLKRQGDLRYKTPVEISRKSAPNIIESISDSLVKMSNDIEVAKKATDPIFVCADAKEIGKIDPIGIDAVITSPPYLNGTNYFRNTKVELWFLGYLKSVDDLTALRQKAVTAGINDVSLKKSKLINNKLLEEIVNKVNKNAYDRRIPKMIHDYFADMSLFFASLKKHLNNNAILAIDLGDSIYANIHVKTDEILTSIMKNLGYEFKESITLRRRISKNGDELKQVLLIYKFIENKPIKNLSDNKQYNWVSSWNEFKETLPHQKFPYSKRNWGSPLHSLCSYQGKLKPSIANMLVSIFVPPKGVILDIFGGVGTISLEAALQGKKSYSFDISTPAVAITRAKLSKVSRNEVYKIIEDLKVYIENNKVTDADLKITETFGFNKKLKDYFHPKTLAEILLARSYFKINGFETPEYSLVLSSILHILHGNRPYALSRRSHGITPFAPTGDFFYKNLIEKLKEKINRTIDKYDNTGFTEGKSLFQDTLKKWPNEIQNIDSIITSPPFFDSTRFYLSNWMRMWFAGWDQENFKNDSVNFIEELQKKDFSVYDSIFRQAKERLKKNGTFVMHLGKSKKCDMAKILSEKAKKWLKVYDIFEESVRTGESHGVTDKGTVVEHQYLILVNTD